MSTCLFTLDGDLFVGVKGHGRELVTVHYSLCCCCRCADGGCEEVVLFQLEVLRQLQLELGLLNVIVDGCDQSF